MTLQETLIAEFREKFCHSMSNGTVTIVAKQGDIEDTFWKIEPIESFLLSAIQRIRDEERSVVREEVEKKLVLFKKAVHGELPSSIYAQGVVAGLTDLQRTLLGEGE